MATADKQSNNSANTSALVSLLFMVDGQSGLLMVVVVVETKLVRA